VELSGWQTVVISLGGGAVTGAAALLVAWVTGRHGRKQLDRRLQHERVEQERQREHERSEQWTDRRVRAADDFATGVEQAILGVRDVMAAVRDKRDVEPVAAEAKRRLHEAVARIARVKLLFGGDEKVTRPAENLLGELDLARGAAMSADPTFAWEKLEKVYGWRDEFQSAAIDALRQPEAPRGS
jgi:hypothetical protein